MNGLNKTNMGKLGLSNIRKMEGSESARKPLAHYTKMQEASAGKDTMTGHWEMMGLYIDTPFRTFPNGFPDEVIQKLEEKSGHKVIANKPASGTEIIEELGEKHMRSEEHTSELQSRG